MIRIDITRTCQKRYAGSFHCPFFYNNPKRYNFANHLLKPRQKRNRKKIYLILCCYKPFKSLENIKLSELSQPNQTQQVLFVLGIVFYQLCIMLIFLLLHKLSLYYWYCFHNLKCIYCVLIYLAINIYRVSYIIVPSPLPSLLKIVIWY